MQLISEYALEGKLQEQVEAFGRLMVAFDFLVDWVHWLVIDDAAVPYIGCTYFKLWVSPNFRTVEYSSYTSTFSNPDVFSQLHVYYTNLSLSSCY